MLNFLDSPVELLIFAAELLSRIVIDHNIGINTVTFDDPILTILGIDREFWLKELSIVRQRQ
ncbi:MAG: hypothetical protein DME32_02405 [Verrucomicrobia bacterium]|nr:MAG: hypothetical protein DME32_02405 [Verrucomicrobiota bacterium]